MADWVLIPSLKQLFAEFNRIAPHRDKASDGSIGDAAHAGDTSDHNPDESGRVPIRDADTANEVHAIDVDADLGESAPTMEAVVQHLVGRCRSGAERRLRYIIYNRRIWEASNGWAQRSYGGGNPHDKHAHFSASYTTSLEAGTASWHLEDVPVALSNDDIAKIRASFDSWPIGDRGRTAGGTLDALVDMNFQMRKQLEQLQATVASPDTAALSAATDQTGRSDEELAAALRTALGTRAAAVGRLLAD